MPTLVIMELTHLQLLSLFCLMQSRFFCLCCARIILAPSKAGERQTGSNSPKAILMWIGLYGDEGFGYEERSTALLLSTIYHAG